VGLKKQIFSMNFPHVMWKANMMKRHWLVEMTQMLLVKVWSKCECDPLLPLVMNLSVGLPQVLRFGSVKVWLLSNDEINSKFNMCFSINGSKIVKWPTCTLLVKGFVLITKGATWGSWFGRIQAWNWNKTNTYFDI
jgi:hypothetical protein